MSRRIERVLLISMFVTLSSFGIAAQETTGLQTAVQLEERAVAAAAEGRGEEALSLAARALGLREARLGAGHVGTAPALAALGVAHGAAGNLSEAVWALEQGLELRSRAIGADHPALAADLYYLGQLELALGHLKQAAERLTRSLALVEKSRAEKHHDRAVVLGGLAVVRVEQGLLGEAERVLGESLAALDGAEDATPPVSVVLGFDRLAYAAWNRGEPPRAEALYRRVARLSEEAHGTMHPEHAIALINLGTVLQQGGRSGTAEHLFRRALGILEGSVKQDDERLALALERLARLCVESGREREANKLKQRLARALGERPVPSLLVPSPSVTAGVKPESEPRAAREEHRP